MPELPYEENALEPVISARTLSFHHGKRHADYMTKLNQVVEGSVYACCSLDEVVKRSARDPGGNDGVQQRGAAWNHDFYWRSMQPRGGGTRAPASGAAGSEY